MQSDKKLRLTRGKRSNCMSSPDFIEKGFSHRVLILPEGSNGRKSVVCDITGFVWIERLVL
jgi:hypothetical protein